MLCVLCSFFPFCFIDKVLLIVLCCVVLFYDILRNIELHCIVLHCIVVHPVRNYYLLCHTIKLYGKLGIPGIGTTASGLRAGKPTWICPFFGDQFFWGEMIKKGGLGPSPCSIRQLTLHIVAESLLALQDVTVRFDSSILCYAILYYTMLCYAMLRYTLFYLPT